VVASGDTLSSIAMRELGSGFLADNIFLLNRDVITDPDHLMAGVKIRLPYANSPPSSADGIDSAPASPPLGDAPARRPTRGLGGSHTVARGDTLSSIAQQYYGSSSAWRFLHEANRAIIVNPDQLSVGMQLSIPPYAE
jgi:nucleoid-associated protein YgaU